MTLWVGMASAPHLLSLPPDALALTAAYLSLQTRVSILSCVCKALRAISLRCVERLDAGQLYHVATRNPELLGRMPNLRSVAISEPLPERVHLDLATRVHALEASEVAGSLQDLAIYRSLTSLSLQSIRCPPGLLQANLTSITHLSVMGNVADLPEEPLHLPALCSLRIGRPRASLCATYTSLLPLIPSVTALELAPDYTWTHVLCAMSVPRLCTLSLHLGDNDAPDELVAWLRSLTMLRSLALHLPVRLWYTHLVIIEQQQLILTAITLRSEHPKKREGSRMSALLRQLPLPKLRTLDVRNSQAIGILEALGTRLEDIGNMLVNNDYDIGASDYANLPKLCPNLTSLTISTARLGVELRSMLRLREITLVIEQTAYNKLLEAISSLSRVVQECPALTDACLQVRQISKSYGFRFCVSVNTQF